MLCYRYCESKYFSDDCKDKILLSVQEKLDSRIKSISDNTLYTIYSVLNKKPSYYWDNEIYKEVYINLYTILKSNSDKIVFDEDMLEAFIIGHDTYNQITDIINDLGELNDSDIIKNRLYRLPTYNTIVEGCLTNLCRFIILMVDKISTKDYSTQRKLGPIMSILEKYGFKKLIDVIDIDIRNSINHGGVFFIEDGKKMSFKYNKNHKMMIKTLATYELDSLLDELYDTASALLLAIVVILNNYEDLIEIKESEKNFITYSLFGFKLSKPGLIINSISGIENNKQLNIITSITDTDKEHILEQAVMLSILIHNKYNDYNRYMISFQSERLQSSWITFQKRDIELMLSREKSFDEVIHEIIKKEDCLIWEASTEDVDLQEIKYFRFPNFKTPKYIINNVKDCSIERRKRLKAKLFIKGTDLKEEIVKIIFEAISWIKKLKNPPSATIPHKYGNMDADSVYINVYKDDMRKSKELMTNNKNFVCVVDYNIDGKTLLKTGGIFESIWNQLSHETILNVMISWRERKYVSKKIKAGRNDPCPCGSGKKYKKCCLE